MVISPETIVFAVRAAVRVGHAARDAYEQWVRDNDVRIAALDLVRMPAGSALAAAFITSFDSDDPATRNLWDRLVLALPNEPLNGPADIWHNGFVSETKARAAEVVYLDWQKGQGDVQPDWPSQRAAEEGLQFTLAQWRDNTGPPHPATRLVLALADVALDYVQINPSILGIGGDGEKILMALAKNIAELMPSPDDPSAWPSEAWPKYYFLERSAAIVLHAGLKTVSENADLIVPEEHYQDLTRKVLAPLIKLYDDNPQLGPSYEAARDTLLGPMARAAFAVLAERQTAFFGTTLDPKNAAGLFANVILQQFATNSLPAIFSGDGAIRLYQAMLRAVAANPGILVGTTDAENMATARALIQALATKLSEAPPPFKEGLAREIAVLALDTVAKHPPLVAAVGGDWGILVQRLIGNVSAGLSAGLGAGGVEGALRRVFDVDQAVAFFKIFTDQVARTPGMILGGSSDAEVRALVSVVARSLSDQSAHLMEGEAWLAVAAAAARAVAANPGRLLDFDQADPNQQLLAKVLAAVLGAAATDLDAMRASKKLLFGNTLRAALEMTIEVAAERADKMTGGGIGKIEEFIGKLNDFASAHPERMGAKDWLRVYDAFLRKLVEAQNPAALVADTLLSELIDG